MKNLMNIEKFLEANMLKYKNVRIIEVRDWNNLVKETYGKPYNFQQQDGCQERGTFHITIPYRDNDDKMNDNIDEVVNGVSMGVKFKTWLLQDPAQYPNNMNGWRKELFWDRNFYPDIQTVANDLYEKGLIERGDYIINIDW